MRGAGRTLRCDEDMDEARWRHADTASCKGGHAGRTAHGRGFACVRSPRWPNHTPTRVEGFLRGKGKARAGSHLPVRALLRRLGDADLHRMVPVYSALGPASLTAWDASAANCWKFSANIPASLRAWAS